MRSGSHNVVAANEHNVLDSCVIGAAVIPGGRVQ
jgi:hypothetical protein